MARRWLAARCVCRTSRRPPSLEQRWPTSAPPAGPHPWLAIANGMTTIPDHVIGTGEPLYVHRWDFPGCDLAPCVSRAFFGGCFPWVNFQVLRVQQVERQLVS